MGAPEIITIRHSDSYTARGRYWRPTGASRGAVLYLHGIQSHGGWFEASAGHLAEAGFHVLLADRRGSGANERERGHARSADRLLTDVEEAADWLRDAAAAVKVTLVGVSWGGKLAVAAAMRRPEGVERLVLVAPGLFPLVDLPAARKMAVGLAALAAPKRRFLVPLSEPELFTDNPLRQAFIREDPLRLQYATARFLFASRMLDLQVRRQAGRRVWPWAARFLLAGKERIVDNERTRRFARGLRCRGVKIIEHTQAAHTLEFEPQPREYFGDLVKAATAEDDNMTM